LYSKLAIGENCAFRTVYGAMFTAFSAIPRDLSGES